jgi:hypothetical protein
LPSSVSTSKATVKVPVFCGRVIDLVEDVILVGRRKVDSTEASRDRVVHLLSTNNIAVHEEGSYVRPEFGSWVDQLKQADFPSILHQVHRSWQSGPKHETLLSAYRSSDSSLSRVM